MRDQTVQGGSGGQAASVGGGASGGRHGLQGLLGSKRIWWDHGGLARGLAALSLTPWEQGLLLAPLMPH